jgi:hypothetical protein
MASAFFDDALVKEVFLRFAGPVTRPPFLPSSAAAAERLLFFFFIP